MEEVQQAVIAGLRQPQGPHHAGDSGPIRTQAQGGQDHHQPEKSGGAGTGRAEWLEGAPEGPPERQGSVALNYVDGGKKTSEFVKPQNLKAVRRQLATYKRFRQLTDQWVGSALKLARLELEK